MEMSEQNDVNPLKVTAVRKGGSFSSRSQYASCRSGSKMSQRSKALSSVSVASAHSSKKLNASLERVHTFGMSAVHKGEYELEAIDNQYATMLKSKPETKLDFSNPKEPKSELIHPKISPRQDDEEKSTMPQMKDNGKHS